MHPRLSDDGSPPLEPGEQDLFEHEAFAKLAGEINRELGLAAACGTGCGRERYPYTSTVSPAAMARRKTRGEARLGPALQ